MSEVPLYGLTTVLEGERFLIGHGGGGEGWGLEVWSVPALLHWVYELGVRGQVGDRSEVGSYCPDYVSREPTRLIDSCITQLKDQGPSRTCNESKEEEEGADTAPGVARDWGGG